MKYSHCHLLLPLFAWFNRLAQIVAQLPTAQPTNSPTPLIYLGAAGSFGVLAGLGITSLGPTLITGNAGVSPGTTLTGFPPGMVTGQLHLSDPTSFNAHADLATAIIDANARMPHALANGDLAGLTLAAGVYLASTSQSLTGTVYFDAKNDPAACWIFQVGSSLTIETGAEVVVLNSASSNSHQNIFWSVGSSATIGQNAIVLGVIMAASSISVGTSSVTGPLLARDGSVTLLSNTVTAYNNETATPTNQPSSYPSVQPTNVPSSSPSAQPISSPSSRPSRPTMTPTGPSALPTILPSTLPTIAPSPLPSIAPSAVPTSIVFSILRGLLTIKLVNGTIANPPANYTQVIRSTLFDLLGLPLTDIEIVNPPRVRSVTFGSTRNNYVVNPPQVRHFDQLRSASVGSERYDYIYNCSLIYNAIDFPGVQGNATKLMLEVERNFSIAFENGNVQRLLRSYATTMGYPAFTYILTSNYSFSTTTTNQGSSSSSTDSSDLSDGVIAGIIIGSIVGALLLSIMLFYCIKRKRNLDQPSNLPISSL